MSFITKHLCTIMCLTYSRLVGAKLELSGFCKVEMSKEVLSEVLARRRTEISAAAILELSTRQTRRLLTAYRDGGGGALIHKARGRTSNLPARCSGGSSAT